MKLVSAPHLPFRVMPSQVPPPDGWASIPLRTGCEADGADSSCDGSSGTANEMVPLSGRNVEGLGNACQAAGAVDRERYSSLLEARTLQGIGMP